MRWLCIPCRHSEHTEWPQNDLEHLAVKNKSIYTKYLPHRGPNFGTFRSNTSNDLKMNVKWVRFALRPTMFEIHGCQKTQMHWMTSDWPWSFNGQKYLYAPFLSTTSHFQDIAILYFPIDYHINPPPTKKKNKKIAKNSKFKLFFLNS